MKVSIGADHAAYDLKAVVIEHLKSKGIEVIDRGTYSKDSCDYPDYGIAVATDIATGEVDRGIVICYTGIGVSIVANKCGMELSKDVLTNTINQVLKEEVK